MSWSIHDDLMEVEHSVIGSLEALLKAPLMLIVSLVTLLALSWKLTLFAFAFACDRLFDQPLVQTFEATRNAARRNWGNWSLVLEETLLGMRIIKAFNAESHFAHAYETRNHGHFKAMRQCIVEKACRLR